MLAVEWDCAFIKELLIFIECDLRASEIGKYRIYQACVICLCLLFFGSHKALSNQTWRGFISCVPIRLCLLGAACLIEVAVRRFLPGLVLLVGLERRDGLLSLLGDQKRPHR